VNGGSSGSGVGGGSSSGRQALPVLLSQHHGLVSALSAAHAAYAPTVRLAKRWLGAHLLLGGQVGGRSFKISNLATACLPAGCLLMVGYSSLSVAAKPQSVALALLINTVLTRACLLLLCCNAVALSR
jgi:hypothetical protein